VTVTGKKRRKKERVEEWKGKKKEGKAR